MSPSPTVSVVMATYNGAAFVADQVESILRQTRLPAEIVVGDDRSSDDTVAVLATVAAEAPVPIRVTVNEQRLGHADNFLRTAERAGGDLIAFADQDDVWLPEKLALAAAAFDDPAVSLWVHDRTMVDEQLRPTPERQLQLGLSKRASRANPLHPMHGSRTVFRAGALRYFPSADRAVSIFGDHPAEHDEWATFGAHVIGRLAWEPRPLILFRRHQTTVGPAAPPNVREVLGAGHPERDAATLAAARSRAEYLDRRAEALECREIRDQILAAAAGYRRLVPRLERRLALRTHPRRSGRAGRLVASAVRGDYVRSPIRGGLGTFALLQDTYRVVAT